jgi:uncharacterized protein (DUF983 family)
LAAAGKRTNLLLRCSTAYRSAARAFARKDRPMPTIRWQPDRTPKLPPWPLPPLGTAIGRGFLGRCPACGESHLFNGFLRVVPECRHCGAPLGLARADDAPPYFTILVTGHIVVPAMVVMQRTQDPPPWLMWAIFIPLTLVLAVGLLRPIKGGTVGLMLRLNMLKSDADGA